MSFDNFESPKSRSEAILQNILGASHEVGQPKSRIEALLLGLQEQLNDLIGHGLEIFRLKGEVDYANELPESDNEVGDVWYVKDKSAGYVWLITEDNPNGYWEELGETFDLANAPNIFFPVDYYNTTFAQIKEAKDQGKIPVLKLNDEYYYCGECYNSYATFSKPLEYGGTNLHCYMINNSNVWSQYEISIDEETSTKKFPYRVDYENPSYPDASSHYATFKRLVYTNYNNRNYIAFNKGSSAIDFFSFDSSTNKVLLLTLDSQNRWTSDEIVLSSPFTVIYTEENGTFTCNHTFIEIVTALQQKRSIEAYYVVNDMIGGRLTSVVVPGANYILFSVTLGATASMNLEHHSDESIIVNAYIVEPGVNTPQGESENGSPGSSNDYAREDHSHPTNKFVVNFTWDNDHNYLVGDKTTAELNAAYTEGKLLYAKFPVYMQAYMTECMVINELNPITINSTLAGYSSTFTTFDLFSGGDYEVTKRVQLLVSVENQMLIGESSMMVLAGANDVFDKQDKYLTDTIILATTDWQSAGSGVSCTKSVTGMSTTALVFISYSDTTTDYTVTQGAETLTFAAASAPSAAVTVNVAWFV